MSVVAVALAELMALGVSGDALIKAIARIEDAAYADSQKTLEEAVGIASAKADAELSAGAARTRRYRAKKASQTVTDASPSVTDRHQASPPPLFDKEVSPTPPSRNYLSLPSEPNGSSGDMTRVREGNPGFDDFWGAYPRREGKKAARTAHAKAIIRLANARVHDPPRFILEAVIRFLPVWQSGQIAPHPTTWLNGDRWDDEIPARGLPVNGRAIPAQPSNNHTAKRDRMLRAIVSLSDRDSRWRSGD